jgi:hypothetical protein
MYLLMMILTAADGSHPKPPLVFPDEMTLEKCQEAGVTVAENLNKIPTISALGVVSFKCVEKPVNG